MTKEFDVVIERDADGYYVASVSALHGCHTQARSLDALMTRIREAIELCLEVERARKAFAAIRVGTRILIRPADLAMCLRQSSICSTLP